MAKKRTSKKTSTRRKAATRPATRPAASAATPPKRKRGRPRLSDEERTQRRLDKQAAIAKDRAVKRKLAAEAKASAAKAMKASYSRTKKTVGLAFVPTARDRTQVELFAGLGLKQSDIAVLIENPDTGKPIDEKTLRACFRQELERGAPRANSLVARSLFRRATGNGQGAVTAAIFWAKVRMGWKETIHVDAEIKSGVLVPPPAVDPDKWIAAAMARAAETEMPEGVEED